LKNTYEVEHISSESVEEERNNRKSVRPREIVVVRVCEPFTAPALATKNAHRCKQQPTCRKKMTSISDDNLKNFKEIKFWANSEPSFKISSNLRQISGDL